jgi:hypothetical protein
VPTTHQPRPNVADQLERLTPRFDQLTHRARLGPLTPRLYNELEAEAQAIAAEMVAAFRGPVRPINPPLVVSKDGNSAGW